MAEVRIPFNPMFRDAMLKGRKTCTSRSLPCGHVGDIFKAFGCTFRIGAIQVRCLDYVERQLWQAEGCERPEEFPAVWTMLHPGSKWDPKNEVVWVHHFALIRSPKVV